MLNEPLNSILYIHSVLEELFGYGTVLAFARFTGRF